MHIFVSSIKKYTADLEVGTLTRLHAVICCSSFPMSSKLQEFLTFNELPFLFLHFDDTLPPRFNCFTTDQASQIVQFLQVHNDVHDLICCCDSGLSRSAAVAAAIARKCSEGNEFKFWHDPRYHPNRHVFKTLCKALSVPVSPIQLWYRYRLNEQALHRAIKRSKKQIF